MRSFDDFKRYHNANYHDGDSHFDERIYSKSNGDDFDCSFVQDCFDHFEAGAASRQVEIDALQKRIDDALQFTQDAHSDLNIGMLKMVQILKGERHE